MMDQQDQVSWEEVKDVASKLFNIWVYQNELAWAQEVWGHLGKAGLTSNENVLESTATYLRLITLARIYEEFCEYAWEEHFDPEWGHLTEDLNIDPIALGILACRHASEELSSFMEDAMDSCEIRESALLTVTRHYRRELFDCLVAAYGDPGNLFDRIWRTYPGPKFVYDESKPLEIPWSCVQAIDFVTNGFYDKE